MELKDIAKIVKKGKNIAICGHVAPDMDCFGSVFSLKVALESLGKHADAFADGGMPEKDKRVFKRELSDELDSSKYDLIIMVDTPSIQRLGKYGPSVINHKNIVLIDHHKSNSCEVTKQEYVDSDSSSCAELCYMLIQLLGAEITPEIATYLYAGIAGDTNSFLNDNTKTNSFVAAAKLSELGADKVLVNEVIFKSNTRDDWKLDKKVYETAELFSNFGIVFIRYKDLKKIDGDVTGTSKYANKLVYLEGIQIGCSVTERNLNTFDCSFRSKKSVDVNVLARKLGGGGHVNASGCVLTGTYRQVREKLIATIKETLKEQGYND